ncbi:hypothetical protein GIB67_023421, partial [Kingdonia uniflora]
DLTMLSEEEEYDETGDEEEFKFNESEGRVSKRDFYWARSEKSFTKNSMSPLNLLHLSHKIMNRTTFGDSHNRMGKVICPHPFLLHRLGWDLNVDRCSQAP